MIKYRADLNCHTRICNAVPCRFDHGTKIVLHRVELCSIAYQAIALDRCATGLYDQAIFRDGDDIPCRVRARKARQARGPGLEPGTGRLTADCSTIELSANANERRRVKDSNLWREAFPSTV